MIDKLKNIINEIGIIFIFLLVSIPVVFTFSHLEIPDNLRLYNVEQEDITLEWEPNGNEPGTEYEIWWAPDESFDEDDTRNDFTNETVYQIEDLPVGERVCTRVRSVDGQEHSDFSGHVCDYTLTYPPSDIELSLFVICFHINEEIVCIPGNEEGIMNFAEENLDNIFSTLNNPPVEVENVGGNSQCGVSIEDDIFSEPSVKVRNCEGGNVCSIRPDGNGVCKFPQDLDQSFTCSYSCKHPYQLQEGVPTTGTCSRDTSVYEIEVPVTEQGCKVTWTMTGGDNRLFRYSTDVDRCDLQGTNNNNCGNLGDDIRSCSIENAVGGDYHAFVNRPVGAPADADPYTVVAEVDCGGIAETNVFGNL